MTLVDLVADLDYSVASMLHFQEGKLQRPPIVALLSDDDHHHHDHDHDIGHDVDHDVDHNVDHARFPSWKGGLSKACDISTLSFTMHQSSPCRQDKSDFNSGGE